jgi:RsiW-degrading membrane proteinase PrsW (M82 family)
MGSNCHWFYTVDHEVFGPLSLEEIRDRVNAGLLSPNTYVAQAGDQVWTNFAELRSPTAESVPQGQKAPTFGPPQTLLEELAGSVGRASGLETLEGFSLRLLFADVFRRHTTRELEDHLTCGTSNTTPSLNNVSASWPAPWAFFRFAALSLGLSFAFYFAILHFQNPKLVPAWIFAGCCGIPLSVLVFFFEANVLRNVSLYRIFLLVIWGGCLSLIISLLLYELSGLSERLGPMAAGIVEELGKLAAVVALARNWPKSHWTLNGMLFGAAVGTGFSAFESAGYVFSAFFDKKSIGVENIMTLRAFLSPFTHTIWTAATAAALWRVKGGNPLSIEIITDFRFVRILGLIAGLHALWNSPMSFPFFGVSLIHLLIGLIGWLIILLLMQTGIKEVRQAKACQ